MDCTISWIMASVNFFVSMIMSVLNIAYGEATNIFAVLEIAFVVSGWILWFIGLINRFQYKWSKGF